MKQVSNRTIAEQLKAQLLHAEAAGALLGVRAAVIFHRAKTDPSFPKQITFGSRASFWDRNELVAWKAAQKLGSKA